MSQAIKNGIAVVPVPDASVATAALAVSGLPTDAFFFEGFLPKKKGTIETPEAAGRGGRHPDFFRVPLRAVDALRELLEIMGGLEAVLCREMTKPHEEFIRGRLSEILIILERRQTVKGEITLVVAGNAGRFDDLDGGEIVRALENADGSPSEVAGRLSAEYGVSRRRIYEESLRIKMTGDGKDE